MALIFLSRRGYLGIYYWSPSARGFFLRYFSAALFDLDGLLADTEDLHVMAYSSVARHLGIDLQKEYFNSFIGVATRENVWRMMKDFGIPDSRYDEILSLRYDAYLQIVKKTPIFPMDGALECIRKVRERRMKRALVTSSLREHAVAVLDNISAHSGLEENLLRFFDAMVFINSIERPKPEPDMYLEALKQLGTPAGECIAFEDSESGVVAAKRAGIFTVAIPNAHTRGQNFSTADIRASSLREVAASVLCN